MPAATAPGPQWVDARSAAKILGVPGARNVHRLVRRGLIKTRDLPGVRAKYLRADVEHLATSNGGREPTKPGMTYLFDIQPEPEGGARLAFELALYKAARERHREVGRRPDGDGMIPGMGAMNFLTHLGELALRLINGAIDRDWEAFAAALDGPGRGDEGKGPGGVSPRFWEALARLQAEGQTGPGAAAV